MEKVWVLVECVSMFRMRYLVEAPADHPEYALDDVTMNDAKEFSQEHIDENIISHRVVTEEEVTIPVVSILPNREITSSLV